MIMDLIKLFDMAIGLEIIDRTEAMKKALRASDLPLAKQHLGFEDGLSRAREMLAEAITALDAGAMEDDDEDDQQKDTNDDETKH